MRQVSEINKSKEIELAEATPATGKFKAWLRKLGNSPAWLNLMYLPALVLFGVFIFYPLTEGLKYSFTNWNGYSPKFGWVGFDNYSDIIADPKILRTINNTFIYGVGSTLLQNLLGLGYALFLDQQIRGRMVARTIIYLPVIISPLIMGYIWYFFFQYDGGAVNDLFSWLGQEPVDWLGDGSRAVWLIMLVNVYQYMGIAMMVYLAGLQAIPREFQEAATIDGVGSFSRLRYITLPLLIPAITVNVLINLIGGFKLFDVIVAMTNGGPGYTSQSLSTMMYNLYFARQDAGHAAALGNVMFAIIFALSLVVMIFLRRREAKL